ncbi:hypothetical protein D3C86_1736070 [compost metagenome]
MIWPVGIRLVISWETLASEPMPYSLDSSLSRPMLRSTPATSLEISTPSRVNVPSAKMKLSSFLMAGIVTALAAAWTPWRLKVG